MSSITMSITKQVNEIEEFTLYHCNVYSNIYETADFINQLEAEGANCNVYECVEYPERAYARSYLKTRLSWLVERINNDNRFKVLFTSIDTSSKKDPRVYFCIKPKAELPDDDLEQFVTASLKNCIVSVFNY